MTSARSLEPVNDFAFSFVAPLGAYDYDVAMKDIPLTVQITWRNPLEL